MSGASPREAVGASLCLAIVLNILFFPTIWGDKTLLTSTWDTASITVQGAYSEHPRPNHTSRSLDPGAPAWGSEPWFKIISDQYWHEHVAPLWNPYAAYGAPLLASQQSQPFYPLTLLLSLHLTPKTYNFFILGRLLLGGIMMFLYARFFVGFTAALAAATTFMFSGYFILFLNMPHLSVEVLVPGIFLTFEWLLRRNSWKAVTAAAAMIFLCIAGGMPESLFLVVGFGSVYFLFRLLTARELDNRLGHRVAKFAVTLVLGFGLGAIMLLPFAELMPIAHDTHQTVNSGSQMSGLLGDGDPRHLLFYLLPMILGPVYNSILTDFAGPVGIVGYWGVLPCVLAMTALLRASITARLGRPYPRSLRQLIGFFAVCLILLLLKKFSNPLVNWIGGLPILDMILFGKYDEPLMALCVAMLAGIGFFLVVERHINVVYFVVGVAIILATAFGLAALSLRQVLALTSHAYIFYGVLLSGFLLLLAAMSLVAAVPPTQTGWLAGGLLALLTLELTCNYAAPIFYWKSTLPPTKPSAYSGAPYIEFLQRQDKNFDRVFARDGLLFPNWAGVFHLPDVRVLDATMYNRYYNFIRSFLLKPGDERVHGDLADRFTGLEGGYSYNFRSETERRFLTLSSVKYLISLSAYDWSSKVRDEVIAQHRADGIPNFRPMDFPVGTFGPEPGIFQHPPSQRVSYKTVIDRARPIFVGYLAILPAAQGVTDGVGFTLEIKDGDQIDMLFHELLNPRDVAADRLGRPFRVDLTRYAGRPVELLFSTDPGPKGDTADDWGGWARIGFAPANNEASEDGSPPFSLIYNKEVRIYQVANVLPRAALFTAADIMPDGDVLARLKAPNFDPEKTVILSRESIPSQDAQALQRLADGAGSEVRAAKVTAYQSQYVRIEAEADTPSLLMLNDTAYPGWRAYVNGNPAPIIQADYLFRGVVLPPGKSVIEFKYAPWSFRIGAIVSIVSLLALIVLLIWDCRRRIKATTV